MVVLAYWKSSEVKTPPAMNNAVIEPPQLMEPMLLPAEPLPCLATPRMTGHWLAAGAALLILAGGAGFGGTEVHPALAVTPAVAASHAPGRAAVAAALDAQRASPALLTAPADELQP